MVGLQDTEHTLEKKHNSKSMTQKEFLSSISVCTDEGFAVL